MTKYQMRLALICVVVCGCVALGLFAVRSTGEAVNKPPLSHQPAGTGRVQLLDVPSPSIVGSADRDANTLRLRGVVSSSDFQQTLFYESGGSFVRVRNVKNAGRVSTVDPGPFTFPEFDESETEFATSYQVFDVAGRQSTEMYVLGKSAGGECMVEKWVTNTPTGAYFFSCSAASSAVGIPVSGVPSTAIGIQGGTYISPAHRPLRRQQRVEILRTAVIGDPHAIACDPEGRFLLLVCGDAPRTLYRLDLVSSGGPIAVLDATALPHLQYWQSICPRHHAQYGRMCIAGCGGCSNAGVLSTSLLFDNNNDGLFDQHQTLSLDQIAGAGYTGDVWMSDFLRY